MVFQDSVGVIDHHIGDFDAYLVVTFGSVESPFATSEFQKISFSFPVDHQVHKVRVYHQIALK